MGSKSSESGTVPSLTQRLPAEVAAVVESVTTGDLSVGPDVIHTDLAGDISEHASEANSFETLDSSKIEEPASHSPEPALASPVDTSSIEHSILSAAGPLKASQIQRVHKTHPGNIGMPTLPIDIPSGTTNLSDLTFNSPSSQIVGTPFTTSSSPTRFEYPFPESPSTQTDSSGASPNLMLLARPFLLYTGVTHHSHPPSPPPPPPIANSPVLLQSRSVSLPPPARSGSTVDSYLAKLRAQVAAPPPIPPSLSKKICQEWVSRQNAGAGGPVGETPIKKVEAER